MPVALRLAEIAQVKRDVREPDEHLNPVRRAGHQSHLGFGLRGVEIAPDEGKLGAEQADAAVFDRQKLDQPLGLVPVAEHDQDVSEAGPSSSMLTCGLTFWYSISAVWYIPARSA